MDAHDTTGWISVYPHVHETTFDRAVRLILEHESGGRADGGLVEHPSDPGGLTKWGIALRYHPHLGRAGILALTMAQAAEIYRAEYWAKVRCDGMPFPVALSVFCSAVNQGNKRAAVLIQRASGVTDDGIVGPYTLAAIERCFARDPAGLLEEFAARRAKKYAEGNMATFGLGWMRRMMRTHTVALRAIPEEV